MSSTSYETSGTEREPKPGDEADCHVCKAPITWSSGNDQFVAAWEDRSLSQFGDDGHDHKPAEREPNDELRVRGITNPNPPAVPGPSLDEILDRHGFERIELGPAIEHVGPPEPLGIDDAFADGGSIDPDDGPGRDQHGPHERHVLDTGDQPIPADDPLMTAVLGLLRDRELAYASRRKTAQRIIAAVREHDRRASHEGATVSAARYTAALMLRADDLEVPKNGEPWQVLDARDETTWHDLTAAADCADPGCTVLAGNADPGVTCIVLVSDAWSAGFDHRRSDALTDVRIPAAVNL